MKATFKQKIGVPDQQGEIIQPGALKLRKFIPLLNDFDISNPIGICNSIKEENNELIIEVEIFKEFDLTGIAHGISFQSIKQRKEGETTIIEDAKLYAVSIIPDWKNVNPL